MIKHLLKARKQYYEMGQKKHQRTQKKSQATITFPASNSFEDQDQLKQSIGGTKTHNSRNNTAKRQHKQQQNNNNKNSCQKTKSKTETTEQKHRSKT